MICNGEKKKTWGFLFARSFCFIANGYPPSKYRKKKLALKNAPPINSSWTVVAGNCRKIPADSGRFKERVVNVWKRYYEPLEVFLGF